jgi:hypothetical protein
VNYDRGYDSKQKKMWVVVQMSENIRDTFGKKVKVITKERIMGRRESEKTLPLLITLCS